MKAIRVEAFGGPEVLRLVDVPDPRARPGQIVVRVESAGVNFIDVYHRTGLYPSSCRSSRAGGAGEVVAVGRASRPSSRGPGGVGGPFRRLRRERALVPAERLVAVPAGLVARDGRGSRCSRA